MSYKYRSIPILCIVFFILTLLWSGFIFVRSSKTSVESAGESSSVIEFTVRLINPEFEELPEYEQHEIIEQFQFAVRKSAHFLAFTLLGFLATVFFRECRLHPLLGFIYGVVFAASDEIHQHFVAGRSCELRDFLIDTAGVLTGFFVVLILGCILNKLRTAAARRKKR